MREERRNKDIRAVADEILERFNFDEVQEHMREYGCHPGYNVRRGEVPSIEAIRDVAGYTVEQLLINNEEAVFIQDFIALRNGDEVMLIYPTLSATALLRS